MRRRRGVAAACLTAFAFLTACGTAAHEVPVLAPGRPDPAAKTCHANQPSGPPSVIFLAKEAVPDELAGLTYFVQDWGLRQGCFKGKVLTSLNAGDLPANGVLVVDISHDEQLDTEDAAAITAVIAAGKRVAIFGWPLRLSDRSVIAAPLAGSETSFGEVTFTLASGCGDWQYTDAPKTPFELMGASYRYENFGGAIFTVRARGPQRVWAKTLFCPNDPGLVMLEVPAGIVAGFSIAYSVSLADNNIRATGMKELLVDVIHGLVLPASLG